MSQPGLGVEVYVYDHASNLQWWTTLGEVAPTGPANIITPGPTTPLATYLAAVPLPTETNWRLVGELQNVDTDGPQAASVDFSALNNFMNYKPFRRGQKDAGTLSLSLLYDPRFWIRVMQLFSDTSTQGSGGSCLDAGTRWWQIRIPGATCATGVELYWTAQGFAMTAPLSASGPDDPMTVDVDVKISSPPIVAGFNVTYDVYYPITK
jgi:hypothetical protein